MDRSEAEEYVDENFESLGLVLNDKYLHKEKWDEVVSIIQAGGEGATKLIQDENLDTISRQDAGTKPIVLIQSIIDPDRWRAFFLRFILAIVILIAVLPYWDEVPDVPFDIGGFIFQFLLLYAVITLPGIPIAYILYLIFSDKNSAPSILRLLDITLFITIYFFLFIIPVFRGYTP